MAFVTSDALAAIIRSTELASLSSDLPATSVFRPNVLMGSASPFELLLSTQLQDSKPAAVQNANPGHADQQTVKQKPAAADNIVLGNLPWNSQAALIRPIPAPKLFEMPQQTASQAKDGAAPGIQTDTTGETGRTLIEQPQSVATAETGEQVESLERNQFQPKSEQTFSATPYAQVRGQGSAAELAANLGNHAARLMPSPSTSPLASQHNEATKRKESDSRSPVESISSSAALNQIDRGRAQNGRSAVSADLETCASQAGTAQPMEVTSKSNGSVDQTQRRVNQNVSVASTITAQRSGAPSMGISASELPIAAQLTAAIEEQLRNRDEVGPASVRIQLDQPGLGKVTAFLTISNQRVSIRMVTQNLISQQIVGCQVDALRQSLAKQGIQCDQCQVVCEPDEELNSRSESPATTSKNKAEEVAANWSGCHFAAVKPVTGQFNFVA